MATLLLGAELHRRPDRFTGDEEPRMLKFVGGTIGVIFLIGLAVVIGLFMLVF